MTFAFIRNSLKFKLMSILTVDRHTLSVFNNYNKKNIICSFNFVLKFTVNLNFAKLLFKNKMYFHFLLNK